MQYLFAVVLVLGGVALSAFAIQGIRTRPGWDSPYGVGALLAYLGAFLVLGGLLNLYLTTRR